MVTHYSSLQKWVVDATVTVRRLMKYLIRSFKRCAMFSLKSPTQAWWRIGRLSAVGIQYIWLSTRRSARMMYDQYHHSRSPVWPVKRSLRTAVFTSLTRHRHRFWAKRQCSLVLTQPGASRTSNRSIGSAYNRSGMVHNFTLCVAVSYIVLIFCIMHKLCIINRVI